MEIQSVQKKEKKIININIKITLSDSTFLADNKVSPTRLFEGAIKGLREKLDLQSKEASN